jgi:hypothetical protein
MRVSPIQSLKRNVTQEQALHAFCSAGLTAAYLRLRYGPLKRIADVYVPFWIYRVRYDLNGALHTRIFALDAVHGALDLFEFQRVPGEDELLTIETRNRLLPRLEASAAQELVRTKVLRVLFQQGFFKLRVGSVEIERVPVELHMPYWLAFYGHGEAASLRVLDAVRRKIEGAKALSFFREWLTA